MSRANAYSRITMVRADMHTYTCAVVRGECCVCVQVCACCLCEHVPFACLSCVSVLLYVCVCCVSVRCVNVLCKRAFRVRCVRVAFRVCVAHFIPALCGACVAGVPRHLALFLVPLNKNLL